MIDLEKLKRIQSGEAFLPQKDPKSRELDDLDVVGLLNLRSEIDKRLPATSLKGMDLEQELVLQYLKVQGLQSDVLTDEDVPPNQKAQVAAQVASTLQQLVKMQSEFHTAERFKAVEGLMIKHFKRLPLETVEAFMAEYEAIGSA